MKPAAAMLVVAGLSTMAQAAETGTLTLACSGTVVGNYESAKPQPFSTSVIVNFTAGTVQGFGPGMIDVRIKITGVNDVSVAFDGSGKGNSGVSVWSINGSVDRVTGDMRANISSMDPETGKDMTSANYSLKCRATQRLF
jgi:hypothetical protein